MFVPLAHGASFKMVGPPQVWKRLKSEPKFQYVIKWEVNKTQDRQYFRTCMMFMYQVMQRFW